jgi:hypothetical protein
LLKCSSASVLHEPQRTEPESKEHICFFLNQNP